MQQTVFQKQRNTDIMLRVEALQLWGFSQVSPLSNAATPLVWVIVLKEYNTAFWGFFPPTFFECI